MDKYIISCLALFSEYALCLLSGKALSYGVFTQSKKDKLIAAMIYSAVGILAAISAFLICKDCVSMHSVIVSALLVICFSIAASDIFYKRIPVAYLAAFCLLAISDVFATETSMLLLKVAGGAAAFLIFFFIRLVATKVEKQEALGMADVILASAMGLALGVWKMLLAFLLASLIGVIVILIYRIAKKYERKHEYAFSPMLTAGFAAALLFGDYIIELYFGLLGISI